MKPEDVGLSGELQFFNPSNGVQRDPRVTCTTIYKCDNFSVRLNRFLLVACNIFSARFMKENIRLINHPAAF